MAARISACIASSTARSSSVSRFMASSAGTRVSRSSSRALPGSLAWAAALALVAAVLAGCGSAVPKRTEADFASSLVEIQKRNPDVFRTAFADGLLVIQIGGDWTDLGATRFACEDVKPILKAHGLGDQDFAIYDRFDKVIATGGRCP
jgi:hypothetical protein